MAYVNRILAATDFSERSARAEVRAAMLGADLKCNGLTLLTVKDPRLIGTLARALNITRAAAEAWLVERTQNELKQVSTRLREGYGVRSTGAVRFGRPATEIIATADEMQADLTVIGAHGGSFFGDLFVGSDADKLVRMTARPLLVVKAEPEHPYRRVLIPVDFSEDSMRAAETALEIAPGAHMTFLHAFQVWFERQMREASVSEDVINGYRVKAAEDARRELNRFIDELKPASSQRVSRAIEFGSPTWVISNYAKTMRPDLIVMGKHGQSRFEELLLGSVTRSTMEQTSCDVLVATALKDTGEWYRLAAA